MNIGIIGAGKIVNKVVQALLAIPEIHCYAIASRDYGRACDYAEKYGFEKAYGSYEEMLQDPNVELVYVATPHSHHYEHMMMCIQHGKHIVCEKAFTMNAKQAKIVRDAAREKGVYVAEAIWPRYMPSRKMIDDVIASGVIGKVNTLTGNLSYKIDQVERIWNPALVGGALLDIGVYGINFALMHFGWDVERVESSVKMTDTGVDAMETITVFYKDGRMAVLTHSIYARSDRKGMIHGDQGYIIVENINNPESISVYDTNDQLLAHYDVPQQINGYEYEFMEAVACISAGKLESDSMPMDDTVFMMEVMDSLRNSWGLVYPQEQ